MTCRPNTVNSLATAVGSHIPPHSRLLDVGTSRGNFRDLLVKQRPDIDLVGLGLDADRGYGTRRFDGWTLPFSPKSFDIVFFRDFLHHVPSAGYLLQQAGTIATTSVVIKDHVCETRVDRIWLRTLDWIRRGQSDPDIPHLYLSRKSWYTYFEAAGLRLICEDEGVYAYPRVVRQLVADRHEVIFELSPQGNL